MITLAAATTTPGTLPIAGAPLPVGGKTAFVLPGIAADVRQDAAGIGLPPAAPLPGLDTPAIEAALYADDRSPPLPGAIRPSTTLPPATRAVAGMPLILVVPPTASAPPVGSTPTGSADLPLVAAPMPDLVYRSDDDPVPSPMPSAPSSPSAPSDDPTTTALPNRPVTIDRPQGWNPRPPVVAAPMPDLADRTGGDTPAIETGGCVVIVDRPHGSGPTGPASGSPPAGAADLPLVAAPMPDLVYRSADDPAASPDPAVPGDDPRRADASRRPVIIERPQGWSPRPPVVAAPMPDLVYRSADDPAASPAIAPQGDPLPTTDTAECVIVVNRPHGPAETKSASGPTAGPAGFPPVAAPLPDLVYRAADDPVAPSLPRRADEAAPPVAFAPADLRATGGDPRLINADTFPPVAPLPSPDDIPTLTKDTIAADRASPTPAITSPSVKAPSPAPAASPVPDTMENHARTDRPHLPDRIGQPVAGPASSLADGTTTDADDDGGTDREKAPAAPDIARADLTGAPIPVVGLPLPTSSSAPFSATSERKTTPGSTPALDIAVPVPAPMVNPAEPGAAKTVAVGPLAALASITTALPPVTAVPFSRAMARVGTPVTTIPAGVLSATMTADSAQTIPTATGPASLAWSSSPAASTPPVAEADGRAATTVGAATAPAAAPPFAGPAPAAIVFGAAIAASHEQDRRASATRSTPDPIGTSSADTMAMPVFASVAASITAATTPTATPSATPLDMNDARWPHAMASRIEALRDAVDATDTRIRLLPDALGTIDVALRRDGDIVHVHFTADQPQTRALIEEAQPRLVDAAEQRGLRLGQTSVDTAPATPSPATGNGSSGTNGQNGGNQNTPNTAGQGTPGQPRHDQRQPEQRRPTPSSTRTRTPADTADDARVA